MPRCRSLRSAIPPLCTGESFGGGMSPQPRFAIPARPPGPLTRSRKRLYGFDAARVAQLRMIIPEARLILIGTAGAIDAHCPEEHTLSSSLYYCRL